MQQQVFENLFVFSIFTLLTIVKFHSTSLIQAIARLRSKKLGTLMMRHFLENKKVLLMVYYLRSIKQDSVYGKMILKIFIRIYL